jgi:hypothetical protein
MHCAGAQLLSTAQTVGSETPHHRRSCTVQKLSVILLSAAGAVALAIGAAPTAAADVGEFCTNLTTSTTKCERPGNAEVNGSLSRANTLPVWVAAGGASGGPYLGTLGGGPR